MSSISVPPANSVLKAVINNRITTIEVEEKMQKSLFKTKALGVVVSCAVATGIPTASWGQTENQQGEQQASLEEVVVTGSRVKRKDLTSSSPVSSFGSEEIQFSGSSDIEDVLADLPQVLPSTGGNTVNNGYDGGATINLRGLGETRSLTLVNSRRYVSGNISGAVDINSIPSGLVERVELVTGGASAVYGSDAMSGVVNFILKDDFEGLETSAQYGVTGEGDGESWRYDLLVGSNLDGGRGNATFYVSYDHRGQISQGDRDWENQVNSITATGLVESGSGVIPAGRIGSTVFTQDGDVRAFNGTASSQGGDRFNYKPLQDLQSPLDRVNLATTMHYNLTDSVRFFAEGGFVNVRNKLSLAPQPMLLSEKSDDPATIINYINHPFLAPGAETFFANNFDLGTGSDVTAGDGIATVSRTIFYRPLEVGPRIRESDTNTYRVLLGLSGEINDNHNFEVFYSGARSKLVQTLRNGIDENRMRQGLNATVDGSGNVVCVDQSDGCVPVNIFGANNLGTAAADWIRLDLNNITTYQVQNIGAIFTGSLGDTDAGNIGYAFGLEWRDEKASLEPDNALAADDAGYRPLSAVDGGFDVSEIFAEVDVPLIEGRSGVDYFGINAAARYSDYSTAVGGVPTYKFGIEYAPVSSAKIRAQYQRAVRAPNINELFNAGTVGLANLTDYCEGATGAVATLCQAQGVADPATFTRDSNEIRFLNSGNINLQEETADTYTIGIVLEPTPNLDVVLDYYSIEITDFVGPIGDAGSIMSGCAASLDPNSEFCTRIERTGSGQVGQINVNLANNPYVKTSGVDLAVNYVVDADSLAIFDDSASLKFSLVTNYTLESSIFVTSSTEEVDCVGVVGGGCPVGKPTSANNAGTPEYKVNLTTSYLNGPFTARLDTRHIPAVEDFRVVLNNQGPFEPNGFGSRTYFDFGFSYDFEKGYKLYGGINNLLDRDPPESGTQVTRFFTNTDTGTYDVNGRSFYIGVRYSL